MITLHQKIKELKSNSHQLHQPQAMEAEISNMTEEIAAEDEEPVDQGNMAVVPARDAPNEAEDQVVIENWTREILFSKYEVLLANNLILQNRIMQLVSPCEDKSEFPEIEDIRGLFDTLRKQYFGDVCGLYI